MSESNRARREVNTLLLAFFLSVAFVFLRLAIAAKGELSRFVVAGARWVGPGNQYLHLFSNTGYDGQFYWRMAADPFNIGLGPVFSIPLDHALRANRIFYPVVAWVLSLGQPNWATFGLVAANVAAVVALAYMGVRILRETRRSPYWALCVLLVPGLIGSLSRDLTEIFSALLVLGGLVALREKKFWLVALAWSLAGLTRETNMLAAMAMGLLAMYEIARRRRKFSSIDVAWIVPAIVFISWQLLAYQTLKSFPILSSSGTGDVGLPLVGFFHGAGRWLPSTHLHQLAKAGLYSIETFVTTVLFAIGWRERRLFNVTERLVVAAFALLVICEAQRGWQVPFDNRYATVPLVLIWVGLLRSADDKKMRRLLLLAPLVLVTVAWRIVVI